MYFFPLIFSTKDRDFSKLNPRAPPFKFNVTISTYQTETTLGLNIKTFHPWLKRYIHIIKYIQPYRLFRKN